jgi:DNA-directed RNA polymerase subunit beta'
LPDGTLKTNPLNSLYRRLALNNESLQRGEKTVPYDATLDTRAGLYKSLTELFGTAPKGKKGFDLDVRGTKEDPNKRLPGIIHMISGDQPKDGFFQDKLIGKKQDYTARATIVVDPNLSVEEIGVPKKIASELFRPMVVRRLIQGGYSLRSTRWRSALSTRRSRSGRFF